MTEASKSLSSTADIFINILKPLFAPFNVLVQIVSNNANLSN